ncbi:MAG TPA: MMPL family transporter [Isosphaeraceae bacterium]
MAWDTVRWLVSRRPGWVVAAWVAAAALIGLTAPNLTELAAEGQARLTPEEAESSTAARLVRAGWPDQSYESLVVVALHRPGGLTAADRAYAGRLSDTFQGAAKPPQVLRVLGPASAAEVAERLVSPDGTVQLLLVHLATPFVSPRSFEAIDRLKDLAQAAEPPVGVQVLWTGNAVLGREYMESVQTSLDRAAIATVFLLLGVLLAVYRSVWLALVPLATIGVGLVVARSLLAWMNLAGWDVSPLVELFLVVILFGCGTDFCLFLSWRYGEHWNPANPGGAMRATLRRAIGALLTSAGTVIVGLTLMGTTHFKLFSSTGPSVALGLAVTLLATLTLTPALLVLLARHRPRAFAGLTAPSSGFWNAVGQRILARPLATWLATLLVMIPLAVLGLRTTFIQDLVSDLPGRAPAVEALRLITDPPENEPTRRFRQGDLAPMSVVIESQADLHRSEGLALIDDVSRLLAHQKRLTEVRSATQPLGDPQLLARARLASRLREVNEGLAKMADGARQLRDGLVQGGGKLQAAALLEDLTGISVTGGRGRQGVDEAKAAGAEDPLTSGFRQFTSALLGGGGAPAGAAPAEPKPPAPDGGGPREQMLRELARAADGAGQIADGAQRARAELSSILADPVGRRALDRLLITSETVRDNPDLLRSFAAYISRDGHLARIDVTQADRMFSAEALDQVATLRRRVGDYLVEARSPRAHALFAGNNAESADVRALTRADQVQTWIIVPLGVFLILLVALRDVWACLNLVATMVLTYAFALGATHLAFVTILGAPGLDWKVPFFLFVLLVAVGVDYNVFLMARLQEEVRALGLKAGINRAIAQTGGLISSAAAITACSFAALLFSPLSSLRQLGFALVVGITIDAVLVRPVLVPCGQWLLHRGRRRADPAKPPAFGELSRVTDSY